MIMASFDQAQKEIRSIDEMAAEDRWMNALHPLVKLFITVFYIAVMVSFGKYNLSGVLSMVIYQIFLYGAGDLNFRRHCTDCG